MELFFYTLTFLTIISTFGVSIWVVKGLKDASDYERQMREKRKEIADLPEKIKKKHNGYINQAQYERLIAKDENVIQAEYDRLEMERKFILEKLPFLSFFKR